MTGWTLQSPQIPSQVAIQITIDCLRDSDCEAGERCFPARLYPETSRLDLSSTNVWVRSKFGTERVSDGSLLRQLMHVYDLVSGRRCWTISNKVGAECGTRTHQLCNATVNLTCVYEQCRRTQQASLMNMTHVLESCFGVVKDGYNVSQAQHPIVNKSQSSMRTVDDMYIIVKGLGSGSSATVYLAQERQTNQTCVLKVMPKRSEWLGHDQMFVNEMNIMEQLSEHENIASYFRSYEAPDGLVIVSEFCSEGNLQAHQKNGGRFNEAECVVRARDVLKGLNHLHSAHIVHGDLSRNNLVLAQQHIGREVMRWVEIRLASL